MKIQKSLSLFFAASVFATTLFAQTNPMTLLTMPASKPDQHIQYGTDTTQFGELRLPKGDGPFPVAVVIHGGCWLSDLGNEKRHFYVNQHLMDPLSSALTDAGIATWNIEYRRIDQAGGGWPGTFLDVANATDYLRKISSQYKLDLNKAIVIGHSAGGHLALWVAGRGKLPKESPLYIENPLPVAGVISLGGVAELETFVSRGPDICGQDVITRLMGGDQERQPERYAQGSPVNMLPLNVTQVLITGENDRSVPPELIKPYKDKAEKAGDRVTMLLQPNANHFDPLAPKTDAGKIVIEQTLHLAGKK